MGVTSILNKVGRTTFDVAYRISPILLTDGVAKKMGGIVPIVLYTQTVGLLNGLIAGGINGKFEMPDLDNMWCHWSPLNNGTLLDNSIGQYPYANQRVAANAIIHNPINISMQMLCPARGSGAMVSKLTTLQALQAILTKHNALGGSYIIITPGQIYTGMLLTRISDTTADPTRAPSSAYQFDFTRPLTQKDEALQKTSTLIKHASGGMPGIVGLSGSGNPLEGVLGNIGIL